MDDITTLEFDGFLNKNDKEEADISISRDDQRRTNKSFHKSEGVRKYVLADELFNDTHDEEDMSLAGVLAFNTKRLELIKADALSRKDVQERREIHIEKGSRTNIVYNEGVRYGAQVALRNTIKTFQRHIEKEASSLELNYNFGNYMLHKNTIIPPIINLRNDGVSVTDTTFSKFDVNYYINEQARFSDRVPNYRDYLQFNEYSVREPSVFNAPTTNNELTHWMNGVYDGWKRGESQAIIEINNNITRLKLDFLGMVRYHMLLKKNMVSEPIISKSRLGLDGDEQDINVGVINFVLDGKPVFELDMDNWTPLPIIDEIEMKQFIINKNE